MGLRDFFKKLTQRKISDGTKDVKATLKEWNKLKKMEIKNRRKGEKLEVNGLADAFFRLPIKKQIEEFKFIESNLQNRYSLNRQNDLNEASTTSKNIIRIIEALKDDKSRKEFFDSLPQEMRADMQKSEKLFEAFDNQFISANYYLKEMQRQERGGKVHLGEYDGMYIDKAEKHLSALNQANSPEKATQFIDAMLVQKEKVPTRLLTSIIKNNPNLHTANDVCRFVNSNLKDKDGNYIANLNIHDVQKICAETILDKFKDSKDGMISENNREAILSQMSQINQMLGGNVYLDFANIMLKSDRGLPSNSLIRNSDLFKYCSESRDCEQIKKEDRRPNLSDIKALKRDSFSILTLNLQDRKKLIDILTKDDFIKNGGDPQEFGIPNSKVDMTVEKFYGIHINTPEYLELVSRYSEEQSKEHKSDFVSRVWDTRDNVDVSSRFCVEVAKNIVGRNYTESSAEKFNERVEMSETLVASNNNFERED